MEFKSNKPAVIAHLFHQRYDAVKGDLTSYDVTLAQVAAAIREVGDGLSDRNPANFAKDIVRRQNRNKYIPDEVLKAGYTIKQAVGKDLCFTFIPLPAGQVEGFADLEPSPAALDKITKLQSLSLSLAARRLANRRDESWLTQVVANLNILHTHFAQTSPTPVASLELLLTNVKLGGGEIDAIFIGSERGARGGYSDVLFAVEMKHVSEVLEPEQVERGAAALRRSGAKELGENVPVVPMGVKVLGSNSLWVVEFDRDSEPLAVVAESIYSFTPAVPGI